MVKKLGLPTTACIHGSTGMKAPCEVGSPGRKYRYTELMCVRRGCCSFQLRRRLPCPLELYCTPPLSAPQNTCVQWSCSVECALRSVQPEGGRLPYFVPPTRRLPVCTSQHSLPSHFTMAQPAPPAQPAATVQAGVQQWSWLQASAKGWLAYWAGGLVGHFPPYDIEDHHKYVP